MLTVLNGAYGVLNCLTFAAGVHPLTAYAELCRLVGQLAIFGPTRRAPEFPNYDHDNLAYIFKWVKQHLRIKAFYGYSENAVKTQIWIAISVYVLVAIIRKRLGLESSLYETLQILSLTMFETTPLHQLLTLTPIAATSSNSRGCATSPMSTPCPNANPKARRSR